MCWLCVMVYLSSWVCLLQGREHGGISYSSRLCHLQQSVTLLQREELAGTATNDGGLRCGRHVCAAP